MNAFRQTRADERELMRVSPPRSLACRGVGLDRVLVLGRMRRRRISRGSCPGSAISSSGAGSLTKKRDRQRWDQGHVSRARLGEMVTRVTAHPVVHLELCTGNLPSALAFYTRLFGW